MEEKIKLKCISNKDNVVDAMHIYQVLEYDHYVGIAGGHKVTFTGTIVECDAYVRLKLNDNVVFES